MFNQIICTRIGWIHFFMKQCWKYLFLAGNALEKIVSEFFYSIGKNRAYVNVATAILALSEVRNSFPGSISPIYQYILTSFGYESLRFIFILPVVLRYLNIYVSCTKIYSDRMEEWSYEFQLDDRNSSASSPPGLTLKAHLGDTLNATIDCCVLHTKVDQFLLLQVLL